uniref:Salutaridine reductase n=1 Tax=Oryza punctata TaxID=4537 RepID=A0A0E0KT63_ORYPU
MDGDISSLPTKRVAVVTGGNKGIGLEVCRQLAADGVTVVLTARDETRGVEAAEKLRGMGLSTVVFHQLEVTDSSSVARLADFLKTCFGKLDILASSPCSSIQQLLLLIYHYSASDLTSERRCVLYLQVNNAAVGGMEYAQGVDTNEEQFVGMDKRQRIEWLHKQGRETYDSAKNGVQTNYYGTKNVIQALLPLLLQSSGGGRVVNVSSGFGLLRVVKNEDLKKELDDIDNLTEERLDEVLDSFLKDFEAGALEAHGWPTAFAAYKMAKVAMNAYTRILARRHPELRVNCAHPGYVKTDMTIDSGFLTPDEGGRNVVTVALLPDGGPTGAFFDEGKEASFLG